MTSTNKKSNVTLLMDKKIDFKKIRKIAESYYRKGDFYCSEAVVKTIKDEFKLTVSDEKKPY